MTSNMLPIRPVVVQVQLQPADANKSPNWWAPLFGFSSEPDYIKPAEEDRKPPKTRFAPGSFTEEKARQLRKMTCDAPSFHETMYHSAIASRLASDFSDRSSAA
ncbi:hypothetical protein SASPL_129356 [Salvia splendens]|uniref:Uncharacterized protein n=1 Tax=Salvia splendens TaxID=180675 RepID=A0A8X8XD65_SALSN|nr:hypothetical protein SASPL_129356 [Salvia splendens]